MSLPKISSPLFILELPSNKQKVKFRPFTVKEEKILLMASESKDQETISTAIKQIITNCFEDDLDIDNMATFDVEYMFINLRSKSVENIMKLRVKDDELDKFFETEVNLDDVKVHFPEDVSNIIKLNEDVSITLNYPTFKTAELLEDVNQSKDVTKLIAASIDKVVNGDDVLSLSDYSETEVTGFIESFTSKNMREIEKFFQALPKLKLDVTYFDGEKEKTTEVVGLQSFFT